MASAVDPRLIVGPETLDDAAALAVSDDLAVCFTADFITPIVDDPGDWGKIAAANSLSDIYAMGAKPLAALNLVGWPNSLAIDLLSELLAGGSAAAAQADCLVVGGHTIIDKEPKYGMAVIGTVRPDRVIRNQGARPGDGLYLSKPLGTGVISTALKRDAADPKEVEAATECMIRLNRAASLAAIAGSARALTDATGFGLVGHLVEMLGSSGDLGVELSFKSLPVLPGVFDHIAKGMVPGGARRNRDAFSDRVRLLGVPDDGSEILLYDPQTSGGLLAAIPPESAREFEDAASRQGVEVHHIGHFDDSGSISVVE